MRRFAILPTATLAIILLAGGCSNGPKDQDLATTIKGQMFSNAALKSAALDVAVKDGEATLTGTVPDDTARYQAYKLASDTPGVKHVVDKMTVQTAQLATAVQPAEPPPAAPKAAPPSRPAQPARPPRPTKAELRRERREEQQRAQREARESARVEQARAIPPDPLPPPPEPVAPPPPQPAPDPAPPLPPPPPQPTRVEIPAGTPVRIQMIDPVDSAKNHIGDLFHASLQSPLVLDGQVVVPAGVDVYVRLVNVESAGHIKGQSELALEIARLEFQGKEYPVASSQYKQTGTSRGKQSGERIGGGAVVGAVLGAVLGGGKGAAIGAATGAGAGTVVQGVTNGQQIRIASETKLDFTLDKPLNLSYFPDQRRDR